MKLSTRCRYGTRALIEIARNHNKHPTTRKEIESLQGISQAYLENILSVLKTRHFVKTIRGAEGGFVLEKEPRDITLLHIVQALEGSTAPVDCVLNPESCNRSGGCAAHKAWDKLYRAQVDVLESITLADLVEMQGDNDKFDYMI